MGSFFLYIFILLFSTAFVWLSEHAKTVSGRSAFLLVSLLIVFVPSAIRYGVGTDFFSYYDIYRYQDYVTKNEYGFYFVNYFLHKLGLSAQWAMAVYAFIFTLVGYCSYPRRNAWVYHLLFVSMVLFFSYNGVRQAISISFILLALKFEVKGKTLLFLVFVFVASTFHQSALFIAPTFLFNKLPFSSYLKYKVFPLLVLVLTLIIWVGPSIFSYIRNISVLLNIPYLHYFESDYFQKVNANTGVVVLLKSFSILALLWFSRKELRLSSSGWLIMVICSFYVISYSLSSQSAAFGRLAWVFTPGVILLIWFCFSIFFKRSSVWFAFLVFLVTLHVLPYLATSISTINDPGNDNSYRVFFDKRL